MTSHSTDRLSASHLRTYEAIFRHPSAHSLERHDVIALFRQLGEVEEKQNGNLRLSRNGSWLVLHGQHGKEVIDRDTVVVLRHFLERSEPGCRETPGEDGSWLLVIDHHEARLFASPTTGAAPVTFSAHAADRYFGHEQNSAEGSRGKELPEPNRFFEPIAEALQEVTQLQIFGTGTGKSSEMDQFVAWLQRHHPDLASRIIGTHCVDESHLTEGQLRAKARELQTVSVKATP